MKWLDRWHLRKAAEINDRPRREVVKEIVKQTGLPEHYLPEDVKPRFGQVEPITPDPSHGPRPRTSLTTDRSDPRLTRGNDTEPVPQADAYLVLSDEEIAKGLVRPLRTAYIHLTCGAVTTMGEKLALTYARDPHFYGGTYCATCQLHRPVGEHGEFIWDDGSGQKVGT